MIELMLVDDHQLLIDGIKSTIDDNDGIRVIAEANNGKEALDVLKKTRVDVVLMDINMPVMDGLECTRIITQEYPGIKVIALSQYPEKRFVKTMMKYGASGYLLKDASKNELVSAIKKVFAGEHYINERLFKGISFAPVKSHENKLFPEFSDRQKEILKLICLEYSTHEIAQELNISSHTVETHRGNLLTKAGVKNVAGLVRWAVENEIVQFP